MRKRARGDICFKHYLICLAYDFRYGAYDGFLAINARIHGRLAYAGRTRMHAAAVAHTLQRHVLTTKHDDRAAISAQNTVPVHVADDDLRGGNNYAMVVP